MKKILLATLAASALMAAQPLMAKTLVYCSEGSPENFAPSVNTTGTSFDANTQIYDTIVQFERGGTKVQPALAEKWDVQQELQADPQLQRRRHHLYDRAAVEGKPPVLQGDQLEPLLFQRHGHAQAVEIGREGR